MAMSSEYMLSELGSTIAEIVAALFLSNGFSFLFVVAAYVLSSLSLYTIACRRGINHPWLAWIPVAALWILGSISDQYQYVTQGLVRNRRKTLLILKIVSIILTVAIIVCCIWAIVELAVQAHALELFAYDGVDPIVKDRLLETLIPPVLAVCFAALVMFILILIETVFRYICYYNLFASCQPDNKVLFLILSILFEIAAPICLMICRNKDLGMPPRKTQQSAPSIPAEL